MGNFNNNFYVMDSCLWSLIINNLEKKSHRALNKRPIVEDRIIVIESLVLFQNVRALTLIHC